MNHTNKIREANRRGFNGVQWGRWKMEQSEKWNLWVNVENGIDFFTIFGLTSRCWKMEQSGKWNKKISGNEIQPISL